MYSLTIFYNSKEWHKKTEKRFEIKLHRKNLKPAVFKWEENNLKEEYWIDGHEYADTGDYLIKIGLNKKVPKIIYKNGTKEWWVEGKLHRIDDPAIEYANGDKEWWLYGFRHRANGPAVIIRNKHYWFERGEFIKYEEKNV